MAFRWLLGADAIMFFRSVSWMLRGLIYFATGPTGIFRELVDNIPQGKSEPSYDAMLQRSEEIVCLKTLAPENREGSTFIANDLQARRSP
jgi:hypothetical protein